MTSETRILFCYKSENFFKKKNQLTINAWEQNERFGEQNSFTANDLEKRPKKGIDTSKRRGKGSRAQTVKINMVSLPVLFQNGRSRTVDGKAKHAMDKWINNNMFNTAINFVVQKNSCKGCS